MPQDDLSNSAPETVEPVDVEAPPYRALTLPRSSSPEPQPVDVEYQGSGMPDPGGLY